MSSNDPIWHPKTEAEIERIVESRMDRLSDQYLKSAMLAEDYLASCQRLADWADRQHARLAVVS